MAIERTFSIIKPDAVGKNLIGKITQRFEDAGLRVIASKMVQLSKQQAGEFYAVHKERPFYSDLVDFMVSGPVVVQVLEVIPGDWQIRTQSLLHKKLAANLVEWSVPVPAQGEAIFEYSALVRY